MVENENKTDFLDKFSNALDSGTFIKMTLGKSTSSAGDLKNLYIRPVQIKDVLMVSFLYRHQTKDITKNWSPREAIRVLSGLLGEKFLHANLFTQTNDFQLLYNKKRVPGLLIGKPTLSLLQPLTHDHQKSRLIKAEGNLYLQQLEITNANFAVAPKMNDKFRQINKFVELIDSILDVKKLPPKIRVTDMGAGKGYLTFALYDHLVNNLKVEAEVVGVEIRPELVSKCNDIAQSAGFANLHFCRSNIQEYDAAGTNMLIALHACDTATDDAIAKGIIAGSDFIVVAPCCHKQVRNSMNPEGTMKSVLKHGIFLERQAELLTDALRSLIMEKNGYKTRVFEFISTEHTPKNVMIVGVKKKQIVNNSAISQQIQQLKAMYGIDYHYLECLLGGYQQPES